MNLGDLHNGSLILKNKQTRVEALPALLDKMVCDERVEAGVAASLHGQMNFAQGQFLGAPLKPAMRFFSWVASNGWSDSLRPDLAVACLFAKAVLLTSKPRTVSLRDEDWEPSDTCPAGAGLVVVDVVTGTRLSCEVPVPETLVKHWLSLGKAQLIAELELLPIVVFFRSFRELCFSRRVLLFVDNNAIRDSVAKGTSKALSVMVLLSELHRLWLKCLACVGYPEYHRSPMLPTSHRDINRKLLPA